MFQSKNRGLAAVAAALLVGGILSACSSGTQSTGGNTVEDSVFTPDGFEEPPAGPKAVAGKKVMVMSCGQNQETCSVAADAQMEAAETIGWDAKLVDYNSDPGKAQNLLRSAIAGKYDGVLAYALDCPLVAESVREVKDAGIFIVGAEALDCEQNGYDSLVSYTQGGFTDWFTAFGKKQGEVGIAKAGDDAKILTIRETDIPNLDLAYNGMMEAIEACENCTVEGAVEFVNSDFGSKLEQKISQALVQHPEVNLVTVPFDSVLLASAMPALRASGKLGDIVIAAAEGQSGVLDLVRNGTITATGVPVAQAWEGWATVDGLNRAFAGEVEPETQSGIGLMAYDNEHNLSESGPIEFPIDYEAAYKESWGVN